MRPSQPRVVTRSPIASGGTCKLCWHGPEERLPEGSLFFTSSNFIGIFQVITMSSHPYSRFFAALFFPAFLAGCAGTSSNAATSTTTGVRANPNVISAEEIRTAAAANAHDLVTGLRPRWLYKRGPQSSAGVNDIVVYMGSARMGGLESLREIPASTLDLLEYLDATKANYKFGRGHPFGAIVVHLASGASR